MVGNQCGNLWITSVQTDDACEYGVNSLFRRALSEGILNKMCHWSSPVIADTRMGAYDAQAFGQDS